MHTVERFQGEHVEAARALWRRTENVRVSGGDEPEALVRFLDRNPGLSFVALDGGEMVGAVLCGHDGRRGYIYHLAVEERCRRRGIGRDLLAACLEALHEAGIGKCHAYVFHTNPFGDLFWKRAGWESREDLLIHSRYINVS